MAKPLSSTFISVVNQVAATKVIALRTAAPWNLSNRWNTSIEHKEDNGQCLP